MKWSIPAKTFLLGEYAALAEASAILINTTPYFELSLTEQNSLAGIHSESPAGLWWQKQKTQFGLLWHDPYQGCGGLGASSAQFIGSYLASCHLKQTTPSLIELLKTYHQCAWNGRGLRPSGYDIIAQTQNGCVYINRQKNQVETFTWPFKDLAFFLIHTGSKLATHHHLQTTTLPPHIDTLSQIVDNAKEALEKNNSALLIQSIINYQRQLEHHHLVAPHTLNLINEYKSAPEVLAIKGCGALGADVLLILTRPQYKASLKDKLDKHNKLILATEAHLAQRLTEPLLMSKNNSLCLL